MINEFTNIKAILDSKNFNVDFLLNLASMFDRLEDKSGINELISQFHNVAGTIPFINDRDFGALLLELKAIETKDINLKKRLLIEGLYRASWCAQGATSGSEGIARSTHLKRLEHQLQNLLDSLDF